MAPRLTPRLPGAAALLVALLVVSSVVPGAVSAADRSGGTVVVGPDETIDDDLEAFAGDVVVRGTVQGDLEAFAGSVTIAEGGTVTGDVDAFAGSVFVAGTVGGSLSAAAGDVTLARSARVGGDFTGSAGSIRLAGTVDGAAELGAGTIRVAETGRVGGDLRYDAETFVNDGSSEGQVVRDAAVGGGFGDSISSVSSPVLGLYTLLVNAALGALLLLAFPTFTGRVTQYARTELIRAVAVGLLALVGVPLVLLVSLLTVVGIPLSLVGFLALGLLVWVGSIAGRIAFGEWLAGLADVENRWLSLGVGLAAVAALVRIPLVGWLFDLLVLLLGFGALAAVLSRRYRGPDDPSAERSSGAAKAESTT